MTKRSFRLSDSKADPKRDVDDELAFHLEMRAKEFMEQGLSAEEARRKAAASFGDVSSIRSDLSAERASRAVEHERRDWWNGIRMDTAYAVRALRKNPSFALAAIATLALGIGATLTVFTIVNGVLLRPMPYRDPERLSMVWISQPNKDGGSLDLPLSSGFFNELKSATRGLDALAAFRSWPSSLAADASSEPEPVAGARVGRELFDILGVRPLMGTGFDDEAMRPGGPKETVISWSYWQARFAGDEGIVGKRILLNGDPHTVVGVMPAGFAFPRGAELPAPFQFAPRTDVWLPLVFDSTDLRNFGTMNLSAVGRRPASVSTANAQADVSGIMQRFLQANAPQWKLDFHLVSLAEQAGGNVRRGLWIFMGAVVFLLLIACANVASLLVARASSRQQELAVRAALGAGHARIARQLVTENLVLAVAGAASGGGLSFWGTKVMLSLVPGSMPRADDIGVDWRVMAFAGVVALVAGVAFGVATAYSVQWRALSEALRGGGTRTTGGVGRRLGRQAMVTAEVALSLTLLIGAMLLTRSFVQLQQVAPGFDAANALTAHVGVPVSGRFDPVAQGPRWVQTFSAAVTQVGALPGVVAAGAVSSLPLSGGFESGGVLIPGRPPEPPGQQLSSRYSVTVGDYFRAAAINILAGRAFDAADDAPNAATIIVNREFANRWLGGVAEAVGKQVTPRFTFAPPAPHTVVGVVEGVKLSSLDEEPLPQVYVPVSQMPYPGFSFVVRAAGDPLTLAPSFKRALRAADPAITVNDLRTWIDVMEQSLARQRFSMIVIGVFAGSALLLAIVGLYGVVSLLVGQRRREIGVRLVLGARPADIVAMLVRDGARLGVIGTAFGLAGALAVTRVLAAMLYGVSTRDVPTFATAAALVLIVSVVAAFVPARRAARVDPTVTLKAE